MFIGSTISEEAMLPLSVPSAIAVHSVTDLRYRLYAGPVDLAPLIIRQARHFVWDEACVSVFVLGASHALTLTLPNQKTFTELLTCLPPQELPSGDPGSGREWAIPPTVGSVWETAIAETSLRGTVKLEHFALTRQKEQLSAAFANENTLEEAFPLPTGEHAWTRVGWEIDRNDASLLLETIHTYPEEEAGIRSVTRLRLTKSPL
jgi:hypothetical protein